MNFLNPGERIYASFKTSRRYSHLFKFFFLSIVLFIIAALIFLGILTVPDFGGVRISDSILILSFIGGFVFIILGETKRKQMGTYYITNNRIVAVRGVVGTSMDSVSYQMIVNVKITQPFLERIFGLGNLEVSTARGQQEIYMVGISNPKKVENVIYRFLQGRREHTEPRRTYRRPYRR